MNQLSSIENSQPPMALMERADLGLTPSALPLQPVADVQAYLLSRKPQPLIEGEEALLITLPGALQRETRALVRACKYVADLVKAKWSVQAACKNALGIFRNWDWKLATFRQKFDTWMKDKDWIVLVNRAKAPAMWRDTDAGLPNAFLAFVSIRYGEFKRSSDGKRQAIFSIYRQWKTGKNSYGEFQPIPGYEAQWEKRDRENLPLGWSESNIRRQVKKFGKAAPAVIAMLHQGQSAARPFLPHALGSRVGLRFLEKVTFDDVRTDWLIFNPKTGRSEEMWVLVARDEATTMVLGFVMLPATIREDGKATHIGARQMKELAAYLLQTYPLPPYIVHWVVERGTATLADAVRASLSELFNNRIVVHYTSMIGGKSPVGFKEKAKGNSMGKASHESHNRLFHTMASWVDGQTGANWGIRPADLPARIKECEEIFANAQNLPEHLRDQVKYPLPTPLKAREIFRQVCLEQNFRTAHKLEGFEEVIEAFVDGKWVLAESLPGVEGLRLQKRMERPVERAMRLIRSVERWDRVSPEIVISFLEHSQRWSKIEASGEINMMVAGKTLIFANPEAKVAEGTKVLCYHNAEAPEFLHVTTGDGRILGTWALRGRGAFLDQEAIAKAMRYTWAARQAATETAAELAQPARERLEAMRAHNLSLEQFEVITAGPASTDQIAGSPVAASLEATRAATAEMKDKPVRVPTVTDCTEDLLKRASKVPAHEDDDSWD